MVDLLGRMTSVSGADRPSIDEVIGLLNDETMLR